MGFVGVLFCLANGAFASDSTAGQVKLELGGKEYAELPQCGGSVEIDDSDNSTGEQLNVVVKYSELCSRIRLHSANGIKLDQDSETFSDGNAIKMSGNLIAGYSISVTLPKSRIANTYRKNEINRFVIAVESRSQLTQDFVTIEFKARGFNNHLKPVKKNKSL